MHSVDFQGVKSIPSILLRKYFNAYSENLLSIYFFSPSPIGTYISVSVALTPTTLSYTPFILSALATAISQNSVTPLGRQLSIDPAYISNAVTQDSAPYTCK
jgi:hypothetical protein